jgi:hypothetical protein
MSSFDLSFDLKNSRHARILKRAVAQLKPISDPAKGLNGPWFGLIAQQLFRPEGFACRCLEEDTFYIRVGHSGVGVVPELPGIVFAAIYDRYVRTGDLVAPIVGFPVMRVGEIFAVQCLRGGVPQDALGPHFVWGIVDQ